LPLAPEYQAIFNETAAIEWFKTVEGLPYGYHNFLFGWVDTPDKSYPPILDADLLPVVFSILEKFVPSVVDIFLNQALNQRLNTTVKYYFVMSFSEFSEFSEFFEFFFFFFEFF